MQKKTPIHNRSLSKITDYYSGDSLEFSYNTTNNADNKKIKVTRSTGV
jgi:hypothetical protein